MNPHDEMLDNVALYALGVLPREDARAVAEHLASCAQCRDEYDALRPAVTAAAVATAQEAPAPSPLLRARIMREVGRESTRAPRSPVMRWSAIAAGFVFTCAAGVALVSSLGTQMRHDAATIAAQSQALGDIAAAKRYRFGDGAVFVNGSHLYVAMPNMQPPPAGMVYQAWTLPKGSKKMAPSVTFMPKGDETIVRLPVSARGVSAVAVSVEPAGGSLQPTSKPIAVAVL